MVLYCSLRQILIVKFFSTFRNLHQQCRILGVITFEQKASPDDQIVGQAVAIVNIIIAVHPQPGALHNSSSCHFDMSRWPGSNHFLDLTSNIIMLQWSCQSACKVSCKTLTYEIWWTEVIRAKDRETAGHWIIFEAYFLFPYLHKYCKMLLVKSQQILVK